MLQPIDVAFSITIRIDVPLIAVGTDADEIPQQVIDTAASLARVKLLDALDNLKGELAAQFEGAARKVAHAGVRA